METIKVQINIDYNTVANLICSAFEGGSNYWYVIDYSKSVEPVKVFPWDMETDPEVFGHSADDKHVYRYVQWPMSEGGRIWVTNCFGDPYEGFLDLESIRKGLQVMADKYPQIFSEIGSSDEDANTGDVFLQCCLFGEVVYG